MAPLSIPAHCRVAVIGGGPAGSTTSGLLAREGIDVVVFERERFPRYHIGESLLLSARQIFQLLGVDEKIAAHGFIKKRGAYFKVKQGLKPGHIDFTRQVGPYQYSYQVIRSEFDKILLDHASESGAKVFEETRVTGIEFDGERPVALGWARASGEEGRITFDYLVDASGLSGLLATKYAKNRVYQENFANVAVGRYFRGYKPYREEEPGAFYMEALTNSSGWVWYIPLHNGTVSVGVVIHRDEFAKMKETCEGNTERIFALALTMCPEVTRLLADATAEPDTHVWQDYSYVADHFSGPHFRLAGDAAGFIDPFFSSGVHMAFLGGLSAAATISSSIKGEVDEQRASAFHDQCIRRAYTRFVLAVSAVYVQIRNQKEVVLHGVAKEDLQLAFNMLQPVVSGAADSSRTAATPQTLTKAMSYISAAALEAHEVDSRNAVSKLIARARRRGPKFLFTDVSSVGAINGLYIRAERGRLGLARTTWFQTVVNRLKSSVFNMLWTRLLPGLRNREPMSCETMGEMPATVGAPASKAAMSTLSSSNGAAVQNTEKV